MLQVHYTTRAKEPDIQRIQRASEIRFYTYDPWLSELDGSLGLSQSC